MKCRDVAVGAAALVLATAGASAQGRQVSLGRAEARAAEPLSLVNTVRELGSGQVVVADPIERKLLVFDAVLKSMRQLGREGSGPGEYRQPDAVRAFPGDSTLVVDLGNARLSVVGPTGAYARSIPMSTSGGSGPPSAILLASPNQNPGHPSARKTRRRRRLAA